MVLKKQKIMHILYYLKIISFLKENVFDFPFKALYNRYITLKAEDSEKRCRI